MAVQLESNFLERVYTEQEIKLRTMIERLYAKSSYYREKLREAGISPGDIRYIEDLKEYPLRIRKSARSLSFADDGR